MIERMYIFAKVDYAIRALSGLADSECAMTSAALAAGQNLPDKYLVARRGFDLGK